MGVGGILSAAFQLYRQHWRTLLAIAAVVVVPVTLLQYLLGDQVRAQSKVTSNGVVVSTPSWAVGVSGLVAALAGAADVLRADRGDHQGGRGRGGR